MFLKFLGGQLHCRPPPRLRRKICKKRRTRKSFDVVIYLALYLKYIHDEYPDFTLFVWVLFFDKHGSLI